MHFYPAAFCSTGAGMGRVEHWFSEGSNGKREGEAIL